LTQVPSYLRGVRRKRTEVIRTKLEISDPASLREPALPPQRGFELTRTHDPELNRWFYENVGADWYWTDRLGWTDDQWISWERRVETRALLVDGERAGYFEIEPTNETVATIAYFGLLNDFHGLGIGGHALSAAIRRGFELAPKVAVYTNTLDGPHALANYEARGMTVVRQDREQRALKR
jgi:RimJ/RimL family protein N-acetyltransferase